MVADVAVLEVVKRFPPTHMSADAVRILRRLEASEIGETVTYQELGLLIGMDVRPNNPGYSKLTTARRALLREKGYVFGPVMNVGVKRLNDSEIVDDTQNGVRRVRRLATRQEMKLASINDEKLSDTDKVRSNCLRTLLAFTREAFSKKRVERIENKVKENQARLSMEATLELFRK